jgi:TIR domain
MLVDFLIVYDRVDRGAAEALRAALESNGASCFLRASDGADQAIPTYLLNRMMSQSSAVVLLVSERAGPSFWQQDDVATIRKLLASGSQANRIALVLMSGTARSALPRDLASARAYDAGAVGWVAVSVDLAAETPSAGRPATVSLGHSLAMLDDVWDDVKASSAQPSPVPDSYRQRFEVVDDDLVVRSHGEVLHRITPDEYNERLTPGQLEDVARIEKSMEINLAAWKRVYPTRAVNSADHALFVRVKDALVEDLDAVGRLLVDGGWYLDDHYLAVREALRSSA